MIKEYYKKELVEIVKITGSKKNFNIISNWIDKNPFNVIGVGLKDGKILVQTFEKLITLEKDDYLILEINKKLFSTVSKDDFKKQFIKKER